MQPRCLEQFGAIDRAQHHVEGNALMIDGERHVDTGGAERPEPSVEAGLTRDLFAVHGEDDIAGLEFGARRGTLGGDTDQIGRASCRERVLVAV